MKINPLTDKIAAIKALRDFSRDTFGQALDLRTCKEAVEQLQDKMTPLQLSFEARQHIGNVILDYIAEHKDLTSRETSREYSLREELIKIARTLKA